jgi:DNA replication protein DnaC
MKDMRTLLGEINSDFKVLRTETCDCEELVEIVEFTVIGGPKKGERQTIKKGCKCWENQIKKEARESMQRAEKKQIYDKFKMNSLMNQKLKKCTFDNYKPTNKTQELALEVARDFYETYDPKESRNLLFSGLYGVGKSHLAFSIVRDLMMKKEVTCIFTSVPKLLTHIRDTFRKDSDVSELQLLIALEEIDVLVLDDIGAEKESDWVHEKIFELIDSRAGKHTIYTTNLSSVELDQKIGKRNFSRLIMDTEIVRIEGEDNRESTFKKWSV